MRAVLPVILWLFLAQSALAAMTARWQVDLAAPRVGDVVIAQLVLDGGGSADWSGVEAAVDGLAAEPPEINGNTLTLRLYLDLPGDYRLPRTEVPYRLENGDGARAVASEVAFSVAAAFDPHGPPPDPAPDKGPVAVPLSWQRYLPWLVAALGAALAAVLLWRRMAAGTAPVVPQVPKKPPHERALARLRGLDAGALSAREFFGELSLITRDYLGARRGFSATTMTSAEIRALELSGPDAPVADRLSRWDLIKFARVVPEDGEALAALEQTKAWVRETAPQADAEVAS